MRPPMLTPRQAAELLSVHPNTIRRWIEEGHVPGAVVSPGGRIRLPATSIDAILQPVRVADVAQHKEPSDQWERSH